MAKLPPLQELAGVTVWVRVWVKGASRGSG